LLRRAGQARLARRPTQAPACACITRERRAFVAVAQAAGGPAWVIAVTPVVAATLLCCGWRRLVQRRSWLSSPVCVYGFFL
jgi:hypothetical protein